MKTLSKRILTGILAAAMIITQLPMGIVYAKESSSQEIAVEESGEDKGTDEYIGAGDEADEALTDEEPAGTEETTEAEESVGTKESESTDSSTEISTEETTEAKGAAEMDESTEEPAEMDEESETNAEDAGTDDSEIVWVEFELEGVYQFGDAPSKGNAGYGAEIFAAEVDNGAGNESVSIEEYIYQNLLIESTDINISQYGILFRDEKTTGKELNSIFSGVLNEHPEFYYINKGIGYSYNPTSKIVTSIKPTYNERTEYDDALFERRVKEALAVAEPYETDLQKAIALHDYLALNCEYDYQNYLDEMEAKKTNPEAKVIPSTSYTAYGVLAKRVAVCEGYALAYKYLLKKVGINCYMVTSEAINHAWNLIELDGKYYQVDVTWADPTWDLLGRVSHQYMFKSDAAFVKHSNDWVVTSGISDVTDTYKATSTTYDNAFWNDVTSPLVLDGDNCYYAVSGKIYKADKAALSSTTNIGSTICEIGTWPVWEGGGSWSGTYTSLFKYNNRLYYNDKEKIYSIKLGATGLTDNDKQTVHTVSTKTEGGYVYGIALRDGNLWYVLRQDPNYKLAGKTSIDSGVVIGNATTPVPVTGVTLNKTSLPLTVNGTATLTATIAPSNATDKTVTWTSDNEAVAKVDNTGKVTAVAVGTCTITATAGGKSATCEVTVTAVSQYISVSSTANIKSLIV